MKHKGKKYLVVTFSSPIGKKKCYNKPYETRGKNTLL